MKSTSFFKILLIILGLLFSACGGGTMGTGLGFSNSNSNLNTKKISFALIGKIHPPKGQYQVTISIADKQQTFESTNQGNFMAAITQLQSDLIDIRIQNQTGNWKITLPTPAKQEIELDFYLQPDGTILVQ